MKKCIYIAVALFMACSTSNEHATSNVILLKNVNLIKGDGSPAAKSDILLADGRIENIGTPITNNTAETIDLNGKTLMPALISTHVHIGTLKGTTTNAGNYTKENVLSQLNKYAVYGILHVQALGTDRPVLFQNGFYDSIKSGLQSGARMLSAGYGFNVPQANIDSTSHMNLLYRPSLASQVPAEMDSLNALGITTVKIWVDDFNKSVPKMDTGVYHSIINEAHKRNMKVAAHVYYLADARRLVNDGIDYLAHSIRDSVVDDALLQAMKSKNVVYIPTLVLDKFSYAYGGEAEWINDPFFKASLEPGVYEMITTEKYKNDTKTSPANARNENGFKIAMTNLKKIFDAGILVALGTDSGAMPIRTQGFSEHLELQLLVEAGLTPMQAIVVATSNAAKALNLSDYGVLEKGRIADLLILDGDPLQDIRNTQKINSVYKAGKKIK